MALDNSSYDALRNTFFSLQTYLNSTTLSSEHSPIIIKHETLAELLESFDVEALEEQTKNVQDLHDQLDVITALCKQIDENIQGDTVISDLATNLETIFIKIKNISL